MTISLNNHHSFSHQLLNSNLLFRNSNSNQKMIFLHQQLQKPISLLQRKMIRKRRKRRRKLVSLQVLQMKIMNRVRKKVMMKYRSKCLSNKHLNSHHHLFQVLISLNKISYHHHLTCSKNFHRNHCTNNLSLSSKRKP